MEGCPLHHWTDLNQSSMVGHWDYFQFSTMINNIAMTIPMDKSLRIALFISLGSIPKAQSFLRLSIVFPNCPPERLYLFTSHQQCLRRPISPHHCSHPVLQNTIFCTFLTLAATSGSRNWKQQSLGKTPDWELLFPCLNKAPKAVIS